MVIRKLNDCDFDIIQHEQVGSLSFVYRFSESEPLDKPDGTLIGAFTDDEKVLMSNLEVQDFELSFNGNRISCSGVGFVCTRPECRRGGSVFKLFEYLFEDEKYDVSLLYPFSNIFYRRLGYENAGHFVCLEMPFANLSFVPREFNAELYDGTQSDALYAYYNAQALKMNLTFLRNSDRYFSAKPYEDRRYTYMGKDSNGRVNGYLTFTCDRPNSTVNVSEISYEDHASLMNLLGFLRTYDGNFKTLVIDHLTTWSPLLSVLPNTAKDVKKTMRDMGSVRVMNLEKILNLLTYPTEHGVFSFYSDDPLERNHGVFRVEYENGKADITRSANAEYDVKLDAAALSRLVLCGTDGDYDDLTYWYGVEIINRNPDLLRAFPLKRTFFTDDF